MRYFPWKVTKSIVSPSLLTIREMRRRGYGRDIMDLLSRIGKEVRMDKVMLTVFVSNIEAIRLYKVGLLFFPPIVLCFQNAYFTSQICMAPLWRAITWL